MFYECVDCHRVYDQVGVSLCTLCYKAVSRFVATEKHRFATFRFRLAKDIDGRSTSLNCLECDNRYSDWNRQTVARHVHRSWELRVGLIRAEELRSMQFRQCPLRTLEVPPCSVKETFDMDCSWCGRGIEKAPKVTTHYCATCSMEYCNSCKLADNINHPHSLVTLNTYTTTAPSEYWKDIADGKDFTHFCDSCRRTISPRISRYMSCAECSRHNICEKCIARSKRIFESHVCGAGNQPTWNYYNTKGVNPAYLERQRILARAQDLPGMDSTDRSRRASTPVFGLQSKPVPVTRRTIPINHSPVPPQLKQPIQELEAFSSLDGPVELPAEVNLSAPKGHRPTQSLHSFHSLQPPINDSVSSLILPELLEEPPQQLQRPQYSPKPLQQFPPRPQPSPQPSTGQWRPPLTTVQSAPEIIHQPNGAIDSNGRFSGGFGRKVFFGATKAVVGGVANAVGVGGLENGIGAIEAALATQE